MRITIRYLAQLRRLAGRNDEVLELTEALAVRDVLARLASTRSDDFRRIVLDADGETHASLLVFLGERQIEPGRREPLCDGDVLTLLTPMAGG